uniref:F-box domain-containing protein n=1 Tax=Oryza meridionalis TaxID=40149 RepID=A0A0E0EVL9_9ORYZ
MSSSRRPRRLLLTLPDEVLEEIFLRLDALPDLARASAACATFRRLITARAFLRRLHSLHPRPLLGFFKREGPSCEFFPAAPPHSSSAAASAVARGAADLTFSFLPATPGGWRLRNIRRGLALLSTRDGGGGCFFPDVVVCDPLHRRYAQIPQIPDDLAAPIRRSGSLPKGFDYLLAPARREEEEEEEEDSSFKVVCRPRLTEECDITVFVFFSGAGIWRAATLGSSPATAISVTSRPRCVHRCVYWLTRFLDRLLILDTDEMELFMFDNFPPSTGFVLNHNTAAIAEAGEGRLGVFNLDVHNVNLLSRAIRGSPDEQWRHDKTIPLLPGYSIWRFVNHADVDCYILLGGVLGSGLQSDPITDGLQYFSLDLKTFRLERLCPMTIYQARNSPTEDAIGTGVGQARPTHFYRLYFHVVVNGLSEQQPNDLPRPKGGRSSFGCEDVSDTMQDQLLLVPV